MTRKKMKFDLSALRKRVEAEKSGGGVAYFSPNKLPDDTTVNIRFLPIPDGTHWRIEHLHHKIPGAENQKIYTCPTMEGKPCPFCERAQKYYNEGNDDMGSLYWRKKRYYANVIIRENAAIANFSELKMPVLWQYGPKIEAKLEAGLMDDDIGVFFDPDEGLDFKLHKTTVKNWANYDQSSFARKTSTACSSDKEFDQITDDMHDLNVKITPALSYEEMKALMDGAAPTIISPSAPTSNERANKPEDDKPATLPDTDSSVSVDEAAEIEKLLAEIESKQSS